jgi:hypothetical protein
MDKTGARYSVISNSEHVRILPPSWGTLYQLTRLPVVPKSLDQAVEFRWNKALSDSLIDLLEGDTAPTHAATK